MPFKVANRLVTSAALAFTLLALAPASPAFAQAVVKVCSTPTVTASSAYTSGNTVGGTLTLTGQVVLENGGGGLIQGAWVTDKAGNSVPYVLWLLSATPTSTQTDKTALALAAADLPNLLGPPISIAGINLGAASTNGILGASSLAQAFRLGGTATSLFAVLQTTGTPTYTSTSDITVCVAVLPTLRAQ